MNGSLKRTPKEVAAIEAYSPAFMKLFAPLMSVPGTKNGAFLDACIMHGSTDSSIDGMASGAAIDEWMAQVRTTPSWPRSWANFSLLELHRPKGMHGPIRISWAKLTPYSLQWEPSAPPPKKQWWVAKCNGSESAGPCDPSPVYRKY
jgi:hypothetical protein